VPSDPTDTGGQTLHVLVAEDNATNQIVLSGLLGAFGVSHKLAANGQEALDALRTERFDAVLMDIQMPVLDGLSAARAIRHREAQTGAPRIPIIAVTANAMAHHVEEYRSAGMDGFVAKPIEAPKLLAALLALV
jgi:CheY-like chemotaxis protein